MSKYCTYSRAGLRRSPESRYQQFPRGKRVDSGRIQESLTRLTDDGWPVWRWVWRNPNLKWCRPMPQTPKSLATLARWGETWEGFVARAQRPRAACQAHPFLSLYQGALPPPILESLFFFSRTSFNHHTVKEPHSEDAFSGHRVPFLPPLSIVCVSYFSESLQEFEISRYSSPSSSPLCPRWSIWAAKKKKSLPGGLVTLGSPIVPWTHRPICDHKKTHHTLSTPHHRVFASPRRPQSGFPTTNV